jgi:septal ring factor EnvC (AmiA/AmiB activator)
MRCTTLLAVSFLSLGSFIGFSQDTPSAIAEREEARERQQRMSAKIEELEAAILSYQQRFQTLSREIDNLRSEIGKTRDPGQNSSTRDAIERLDKKIEEVDRKRMAEQEHIVNELARLRKDLLGSLARPTPPKSNKPPANVPEKGMEYEIREGDYLSKLVVTLNKQGYKVTQKQLRDANPSIDWDKLKIGQKIFIPTTGPN